MLVCSGGIHVTLVYALILVAGIARVVRFPNKMFVLAKTLRHQNSRYRIKNKELKQRKATTTTRSKKESNINQQIEQHAEEK